MYGDERVAEIEREAAMFKLQEKLAAPAEPGSPPPSPAPSLTGSNGAAPAPANSEPAAPNAAEGRGPGGKFAVGNKCARGNPHARQMAKLRTAFLSVVDEETMKKLARRLLKQADEGDMVAAKLVLAYAIGKPLQGMSPDLVDLHEWAVVSTAPHRSAILAAAIEAVPPEVAVELLASLQAGHRAEEIFNDVSGPLLAAALKAHIGKRAVPLQ
jgi:hypothetical protein